MSEGTLYSDARRYALSVIAASTQAGERRGLLPTCDPEDVADAFAMACVMGLTMTGAFWYWAARAELRDEDVPVPPEERAARLLKW